MSLRSIVRLAVVPAALGPTLLACAGPPPRPPAPSSPPAAAAAAAPAEAAPPPYSREMLARGDALYHGRAGGALCWVCHGRSGRGTTRGPDLTDRAWLHGDGSYESIVAVIATGVPDGVAHRGGMLPGGGTAPDSAQVRALAAYVHSLGRRSR